jgi:hypothetical protein
MSRLVAIARGDLRPPGGRVSSAILYFAIIAIWAGFLVPAWLRRPHANSHQGTVTHAEEELTVQYDEELTPTESGEGAEASVHVEVSEHVYVDETVYSEDSHYTQDFGPEYPEHELPAEAGSGPPAPRPSQSREQMLRARRRMLSILVAMTAVTGAFTYLGLVAWWIVVPPVVLTLVYALLLREIAKADAELARKRAAWEAADARAYARHMRDQAPAEREAHDAAAASSGAQIIDISGRVSDQLYDQYADAAVRAVGD